MKMLKIIVYVIIVAIVFVGGYLIVRETAQAPSPSAQKPTEFVGPTGNPPTSSSPSQPLPSSPGINY